jgi:ribosomal protein S18 acetylase RimI-like enzyme
MPNSGQSLIVENPSGLIVGYVFVHPNTAETNGEIFGYVRSVAVREDHRRRGYGKALMTAVVKQADREVDLYVDEDNAPAIELYKSLGFQRSEICPTATSRRRMVLLPELFAEPPGF